MRKLYIVMYHYTRDLVNSRYPEIKGLDYQLFKQQIDYFAENFHVVTMEQVIEAVNSKDGGRSLPENAMLLTFDDGYIDNFVAAFPVLKVHGMQGSFFIPGKTIAENVLLDVNKIHFVLASADIQLLVKDVLGWMDYYRGGKYSYAPNNVLWEKYAIANRFDCKETVFVKRMLQTVLPEALRNQLGSELFTKYVGLPEDKFARELYMNYDQIRLMKQDGMFIGFHGYDHYWLANLTEEEMHRDIDRGLDAIDEFIDRDAWVINYPYGNNNLAVTDYARSKGCKLGLTTEVRVAQIGGDNKFLLPRFDCNDFPPKSENYKMVEASL